MLQMPKPFANPQTYQEIQYKASRGKKTSFKTEEQTYSNPILLSKVAQTRALHRRRNLEHVRGWEAAGAKQLQRKTLRNHVVRTCSHHRRRRGSLAGANSGTRLHCSRTHSRTPVRHRCPQRFGFATTRRSGITNMGTTAPESRSPTQTKELQGKAPEAAVKVPSFTWRG